MTARADLIAKLKTKGWRMKRLSPIHFGLHHLSNPHLMYMLINKTSRKAWARFSMDELRGLARKGT